MDSNPAAVAAPQKSREILNFLMDSTRWNAFPFRDGDIVVGTWAKSGTTFMQQIVAQLVFNGDPAVFGQEISPWPDLRMLPSHEIIAMAEAQHHRRFLKTHLPADALAISPKAKYIYVGRDARDVFWSWHHHHSILKDAVFEIANPPDRTWPEFPRADSDIRRAYNMWLENDGYPVFPFWSHVQSWWDIRHAPNVRLYHYNNLRDDLPGSVRDVAAYLDIPIDENAFPNILRNCSLDSMKKRATSVESLNFFFEGGGGNFINKGTNGRWKDVLSAAEVAKADTIAAANLTPDCAHWLKTGEMPA